MDTSSTQTAYATTVTASLPPTATDPVTM